eukprot:g1720.t1
MYNMNNTHESAVFAAQSRVNYGAQSYWDERYAAAEFSEFDWYTNWDGVRRIVESLFSHKDIEILLPGCGNSGIPRKLYSNGYRNLTCVDHSQVVIHQIRDLNHALSEVEYYIGDACCLPNGDQPSAANNHVAHNSGTSNSSSSTRTPLYDVNGNVLMEDWSESYDLIFDKALLDSLLCRPDGILKSDALIKECHRCLKTGGVYLLVSHGVPESRLRMLQKTCSWKIRTVRIPKPVVKRETLTTASGSSSSKNTAEAQNQRKSGQTTANNNMPMGVASSFFAYICVKTG